MATKPNPDRNHELMYQEHGTKWLITDRQADQYLKKNLHRPNDPPEDRNSRSCGGTGGFDDYVEWWD